MTLASMLTELSDLLADSQGVGLEALSLASDARKLAYLDEGQEQFCEDTGYFLDATTFTISGNIFHCSICLS